jgi:hypothetical protein
MALKITARDRLILNKLSHAFVISELWEKIYKTILSPQDLADIEAGKSKSLVDTYFDMCPDVKAVWQCLQKEMPKVHKALAKEFDLKKKSDDN